MIIVNYWVGKENSDTGFEQVTGDTFVSIKMSSFKQDSIMAYVDYREDSTDNTLILHMYAKEKHIPNDTFYSDSQLINGDVEEREVKIKNTSKVRFPFVLALNEDDVQIDVKFDTDDSNDYAEVYLIPSSPYI